MKSFCGWLLALAFGSFDWTAGATVIDPSTWEEIVERSDFVGTVECEVAGGIVAEYRVLEAWKGSAKPGERIRIRIWPDSNGPSFPVALCRELYVMAASNNSRNPPVSFMSISRSYGGGQPLMWRSVQWQYQTSPYQGMERLNPNEATSSSAGTKRKQETLKFINANDEQKELMVLRGNFEKYLGSDNSPDEARGWKPGIPVESVINKIRAADSVAGLCEQLNQLRVLGGPRGTGIALSTLKRGSQKTLDYLAQFSEAEIPEKSNIVHLIEILHPDPARSRPPEPERVDYRRPSPAEPDIEQVAEKLQVFENAHEAMGVLDWLIENRPEKAAEILQGWTPRPHSTHRWDAEGYVLGSKFGKYCPSNRIALLGKLTQAKDPLIRVSAAVYLCFDDLAAGLQELERLKIEDGDAGAWAALTLARRGRKESVDRALGLLKPVPNQQFTWNRIWDLSSQLKVLLSNSAQSAGILLPETDAEIVDWWAKNSDRLTVGDPWMTELDKERTD